MNLLATVLTFLGTKFGFLFTAVSGVMSTILSELADDEIAIIHGALGVGAARLKAGGSLGEACEEAFNWIGTQEKNEISKVGMLVLEAMITASAPPAATA